MMYIGIEGVIYMRDFEVFFKVNKNKIMGRAKANTHYNKDGLATISKKMIGFMMMYGRLILGE